MRHHTNRVSFLIRNEDLEGRGERKNSREPGLEVTAGTALLAALSTTPVAVGAVGARGTVRATLAGSTLARASGTDLLLERGRDDLCVRENAHGQSGESQSACPTCRF